MSKSAQDRAALTGAAKAKAQPVDGMIIGTHVLTLDGALPVEFLTPGDRIITRMGARTLRQISVSEVRNAQVVTVRAGSLGHDRPGRDLALGAAQKVLVRDWRAKALFGAAQAFVEVSRLADGEYVSVHTAPRAKLFQLHFDADETIYADGVELQCAMQVQPA